MSTSKWIDGIVRAWVEKTEDEVMLAEWKTLMEQRIAQLQKERHYTTEELAASLKGVATGDVLYAEKRVRIDGELYEHVYFFCLQPRKKRVWVTAKKGDSWRKGRCLTFDEMYFHQLARTELAVRRRSMLVDRPKRKPRWRKPIVRPNPTDDIPF